MIFECLRLTRLQNRNLFGGIPSVTLFPANRIRAGRDGMGEVTVRTY